MILKIFDSCDHRQMHRSRSSKQGVLEVFCQIILNWCCERKCFLKMFLRVHQYMGCPPPLPPYASMFAINSGKLFALSDLSFNLYRRHQLYQLFCSFYVFYACVLCITFTTSTKYEFIDFYVFPRIHQMSVSLYFKKTLRF